jgi:phospholipid transport system substrate-binding protein
LNHVDERLFERYGPSPGVSAATNVTLPSTRQASLIIHVCISFQFWRISGVPTMNPSLENFSSCKILRSVVFAATFALTPLFSPAQAASPAEAFIQGNIEKGLAILNDKNISGDQRVAQFRTFLLGLTDLKRVADYTLGPAKNTASPNDLAAFEAAFRDYAFAVYDTELSKYAGQTLRVTGSIPRRADEWLITTQLIDPRAQGGQEPTEVDFLVSGNSGRYMIVDITVLGMDLAITEQDQFQLFLSQHGNSISALTADLRRRAATVRATGSAGGTNTKDEMH